jgi:hypothetical protein
MKNITKTKLLELGFDEEFTSAEDSGQEEGYYYYTFNIDDECLLISDASDESGGLYTIEFFEFNDLIQIQNIEDLTKLVETIKSNTVKK